MRVVSMFVVLLMSALQVFAGANIAGKVTDEKGEAIIGATVIVKNTSLGTVTDVDGNFNIPAEAGSYILEVKSIGYQTKEVADVVVSANNVTRLNVTLSESSSTQLNEVVVHSSLKKENIGALYTIQKNSATISDGISADVIRKSPDRSTGEVLKRVSGTTIQDNKFVIVRGLSDRYNAAMVDNAILPSTEPNRKAFSFDIIPANLIDNIIISKTATPDLPGDFAGGVINILTKEIPDQNFNTLSLGASYNTIATFKTFKSGYRSSTDFLGFDDGARKLPADFPSTKAITSGGLTAEQNSNIISKLNNNNTVTERSALPGMNLQSSIGRSWAMKGDYKIGLVAAVNYAHNETREEDVQRTYNDYNYVDNSFKYSSNLGVLMNLGLSAGRNKVVFKGLYNEVFDDNFLFREGSNGTNGKYIRYYAFDLLQKSLLKTSLEGDHQLGGGQSRLNWILTYNRVTNDQPDQRKISYYKSIEDAGNQSVPFLAEIGSSGKANNRLFSKLGENIYSGGLNYLLPLNLLSKTTLKAGVFGQYRSRQFDARFMGLVLDMVHLTPEEATAIQTRPVETVFADDLIDAGKYQLVEGTLPSDAYDANSVTAGGYVMLDNRFTERLRLVWGARVESFNVQLDSKTSLGAPLVVDKSWLDVLPSLNFTYSLNESSNLRASYYRTVARPEFRELAPFAYYDYELSALSYGNQNLERSQIDNMDLRFETYPRSGEIFSASVFYKHFNNTLESNVNAVSSQLEITTVNYPGATNIGAEMEIRKSLDFISKALVFRNLSFYANLAYIKSVVKYSYNDVNGNVITGERPLTGQSNYVANASLGYSALEGKLGFNVLYNRIGSRIVLVGDNKGGLLPGNVWEKPRDLLDFQVSCNISKKSELRLTIKDILGQNYVAYYDQNRNNKQDSYSVNENGNITGDWILKSYKPGTMFSLSYTWKF